MSYYMSNYVLIGLVFLIICLIVSTLLFASKNVSSGRRAGYVLLQFENVTKRYQWLSAVERCVTVSESDRNLANSESASSCRNIAVFGSQNSHICEECSGFRQWSAA